MKDLKQSKKRILLISCAVTGYLLLVYLLYSVEMSAEGSNIHSFSQALWYSFVTMTTVGYGDFYPVTTGGRVIGFVFLLVSVGLLAYLLSLLMNVFNGRILPELKILLFRGKNTYIFSDLNDKTKALAEDIYRQNHDTYFIFLSGKIGETGADLPTSHSTCIAKTPAEIRQLMQGQGIFLAMGMDQDENYFLMKDLQKGGYQDKIYCETDLSDTISDQVECFCTPRMCARQYWQQHPLKGEERRIILVGLGTYGQSLLDQALLVNVRDRENLEYHVFGSTRPYRSKHPALNRFLKTECVPDERMRGEGEDPTAALLSGGLPLVQTRDQRPGDLQSGDQRPGDLQSGDLRSRDRVVFHEMSDPAGGELCAFSELLQAADRIILCMDSDADNIRIYHELVRYIPGFVGEGGPRDKVLQQKEFLHMRMSEDFPTEAVTCFGMDDSLYVERLVIHARLDHVGRALHSQYLDSISEEARRTRGLPWEDLPEFKRKSNLAAADHLYTKVSLLLNRPVTDLTPDICREAFEAYEKERKTLGDDHFRRIEHSRWMRYHFLSNYQAGERDDIARRHELLVPFEELSPQDQAYDDSCWSVLGVLPDYL